MRRIPPLRRKQMDHHWEGSSQLDNQESKEGLETALFDATEEKSRTAACFVDKEQF